MRTLAGTVDTRPLVTCFHEWMPQRFEARYRILAATWPGFSCKIDSAHHWHPHAKPHLESVSCAPAIGAIKTRKQARTKMRN